MSDSYPVYEHRWTENDIAAFYDDEHIALIRRRSAAFCALALLIVTIAFPSPYWALLIAFLIGALLLDYYFRVPIRARHRYEALLKEWGELLAASDPAAPMATSATLAEGERLIYAAPSVRYGDVPVNGRPVNSQVDAGELIVTDRRVLFLGRKTLGVSRRDIVRHTMSYFGNRIAFEYPGRPAGETFSVTPRLFPLCMSRRGGSTEFSAAPPAPLPLDITRDQLEHARRAVEALA